MTIDQALGILNPQPRTLEGLKKAFKMYANQILDSFPLFRGYANI